MTRGGPVRVAENHGVANRIQSLLGAEYPVVQAPMTYIARAELAAAVSEGGGMGMIETLTPDGRADLRRVRELTDRPVAANLMIQGWKRDPSIQTWSEIETALSESRSRLGQSAG